MQENRIHEVDCVMPPSPELEKKIIAAKSLMNAGGAFPAKPTRNQLDLRSLSLILSRPARTRPDTFVDARAERAPVTGTRRALVLLVDFSDKAATKTATHFNDMLFSVGTYATGSMRDFYREASYTKLDVIGLVSGSGGPTAGWYRAPQPKSFYTSGNYGFGTHPNNAQKLVEDAIALADPNVNFADYDNDGDGVVDALVVICAGSGGEQTGNVNDIWSHKWDITPQVRDGVTINRYFMAPEDGRVGVMAHELGHLLMGWPDLYDTDYTSAGTGGWDLMAGGSWNGGGDRPAHPTCWCKTRAEWVSPTVLWNATQSVNIPPYASSPIAYKLPIGSAGSQEYFLVSNRQQSGFDTALPGRGAAHRARRRREEQQHRREPLPRRHRAGRRPARPQPQREPGRRLRPVPHRDEHRLHRHELAEQQRLQRRSLERVGHQDHPRRGQHHGRHPGRDRRRRRPPVVLQPGGHLDVCPPHQPVGVGKHRGSWLATGSTVAPRTA